MCNEHCIPHLGICRKSSFLIHCNCTLPQNKQTKLLKLLAMFITIIWSRCHEVFVYAETQQTEYVKYMQFFVYQ